MLFFARVQSKGLVSEAAIGQVLLLDGSEINEWAVEHARVVLGPSLLPRLVRTRAPRRPLPSRPAGGKARLTNATLADGEGEGRAPRYACFDALVEKLVTDPVDREDLTWLRRRAYQHCGVEEGDRRPVAPAVAAAAAPDLLLLVSRGETSLGDRATTARQTQNAPELKAALARYAAARGLRFAVTSFGGRSYCDQVRLAAQARVLIGVHGQALTNGIFMREESVVVELFHGGAHPYWAAFDNVGHQPLYLGAGRPYVAAPLAESRCTMMRWKHAPHCASYVNATRVIGLLERVRATLQIP